MASINRRRPTGYRGGRGQILTAVLADARAALAYAHDLCARARARDPGVPWELLQEGIDSVYRAKALCRVAGGPTHDSRFYEAMQLEGEISLLHSEASVRFQYGTDRPFVRRTTPARDNAARILSDGAGEPTISAADILESLDAQRRAYRRAARRLHPDVGGETAAFQRLEAANRHLVRGAGGRMPKGGDDA